MSHKVLKALPAGDSQRFKFQEFSGEESEFPVFEGNTVNLVEQEELVESDPLPDPPTPSIDLETIIKKAERDAESIRSSAREKAAQIERDAYEKGLAEGQKTGELVAQQKMETILNRFHLSLNHLDQVHEVAMKGVILDVIDLVLFVAEKVIHDHVKTHPGILVDMVREAVKSVKEKEQMMIFLNPEDFAFISENENQTRTVGLGGSVKLEQDAQLTRGSIKIKTSYGDVDATIETQLNLIKKQVQNRLLELQ